MTLLLEISLSLPNTIPVDLTATLPSSGTVQGNLRNSPFAGALAEAGVVATVASPHMAGAASSSGQILKLVRRPLAGIMAQHGAIILRIDPIRFVGATALAGTLRRLAFTILSGAQASTGALSTSVTSGLFVQVLAGAIALSGALTRRVSAGAKAGAMASAGGLQRLVKMAADGIVALAGEVTEAATVISTQALGGALASAGVVVASVRTRLSGALGASGRVVRLATHRMVGTLGLAGTLATLKTNIHDILMYGLVAGSTVVNALMARIRNLVAPLIARPTSDGQTKATPTTAGETRAELPDD